MTAHRVEAREGGREFVCGDIHGCYVELMAALDAVAFDRERDHLTALGDLVDRGPRSADVVRLLDEPWFDSIMGNHEVMMIESASGNLSAQGMHYINGGSWFAEMDASDRQEMAAKVRDLPIAMTIATPTARKIGLVHADIPGADWDEFLARVDQQSVQDYALWARERVATAKRNPERLVPIRNADHVYFGHTPMGEPLHAANMSWIDTGCFATGNLTLVELK